MSMTVVASLNVRDIVTESRGLEIASIQTLRVGCGRAHFAGHPSVKFVFAIRVTWSNTSRICAFSTAGSHSLRSSGVTRTDFHESMETASSATGISRTALQTLSPDLPDLRCTTTSVSSGEVDALPFPLEGGGASLGMRIRFHSGEEDVVRSFRKCASASFKALYHDWWSLGMQVSFTICISSRYVERTVYRQTSQAAELSEPAKASRVRVVGKDASGPARSSQERNLRCN